MVLKSIFNVAGMTANELKGTYTLLYNQVSFAHTIKCKLPSLLAALQSIRAALLTLHMDAG